MISHLTPPKVQYLLHYTDSNSVLQTVDVTPDFAEWKTFETSIVRDDLTGAYIQIQNGGISFTGDSYDVVRSVYESKGFRAQAKLIINLRKDTFPDLWTYEQKLALDLNFAKYERTNTTITMTANENGLKSMIKANGGQKYDIPVSGLSPNNLVYDGLEIKESFTWFTAPIVGVPTLQFIQESLQSYMDHTVAFGFFPPIQALEHDVNPFYKNSLIQQSQTLSHSTSLTTNTTRDWDGSGWPSDVDKKFILKSPQVVPFIFSIKGKLKMNFGARIRNLVIHLNYIGSDSGSILVCSIPNVTSSDIVAVIDASITVPNNVAGRNYFLSVEFNSYDLTNPYGSNLININQFEFESGSYVKVEWKSTPQNKINIPIVSEQNLCQSLIDKLTETTGIYTATVDNHNELIKIAAGESIRNFKDSNGNPLQYLHTSFNDFCNYMKSCWGYEYDITDNAIRFRHRDNFFLNEPALTISEITDYKISVNERYIYTGVKIGIALVQYLSVNGTDEFRFLNEWSTGVKNVVNVLDLMCPYRTDSYGFQLLADKQHELNSTDDQSDSNIFVIHVQAEGDHYIPDRNATITGVFSSTMFNACFSPRQCLVRNASLLGISTGLLKFTSTLGNSDISIDGVSEKRDIKIVNSLFSPDVLDMEIGDIIYLPENKNGLIFCEFRGEQFHGFIKKLSHNWGENKKTACTLFLQKDVTEYFQTWGIFVCEIHAISYRGNVPSDLFYTSEEAISRFTNSYPYYTDSEGAKVGSQLFLNSALSMPYNGHTAGYGALSENGITNIFWVQIDSDGYILSILLGRAVNELGLNNGYKRSETISIVKKFNGTIVSTEVYSTLDSFTFNSFTYSPISSLQFQQLTSGHYNSRMSDFISYIESFNEGLVVNSIGCRVYDISGCPIP